MKILVACGGDSPERDVSLSSGTAVAAALADAGHDAVKRDIVSPNDVVKAYRQSGADIVFVAFHGSWGEDGRLQAILECNDVPYTGSGIHGCMMAMDKEISLAMFRDARLPVPPGLVIGGAGTPEMILPLLKRERKIVLKPCSGGSTVGVSVVDNPSQIEKALKVAMRYDKRVVAERYIQGSEVTVAILDCENGPVALPPIEIQPACGFYDYNSKYTQGASEYLCPAPLDKHLEERVKDLAVSAHRVLRCRVYSRVDMRISDDGRPYLLEVNTAPGMTATSLVPKAAEAAGMSFGDLLNKIINSSFCKSIRE